MGIYLKYGCTILLWAGLFTLSYVCLSSRSEEVALRLHKELSAAHYGQRQSSSQTISLDGTQQLSVQTVTRQNPELTWVTSTSKLTDTEDFEFEVYFQPSMIYLHALNGSRWSKADYTHPVAGQLAGLKEPMAFWLRLLQHAAVIERTSDELHDHYIVRLKPFEDEIHGMRLTEVEEGTMQVWVKKQSVRIETLKLDVRFKHNIIRGYDWMTYNLELVNSDKEANLTLPKEAETAENIK